MGFYKENKNEILTMQLISQILGKVKLEYAAQEPQWAHIILDITTNGFSTGLLKLEDHYFEIEADLIRSMIKVKTKNHEKTIKMEDGKSISQYYNELIETAQEMGLVLDINTKPQEMATTVLFEDDTEHHHYNEQAAAEMLEWFQFAWDAELQFIAPFRQRKVYPGLFWGTFDVSCIILYNEFESFPDDSKVIERGAFDEHMIEFGFWLGDDNIEHPSFFTLPYPFVEGVELEIDDSFPAESYFSAKMAEYIYEIKGGIDNKQSDQAIKFMEASCSKSLEYLKWENVNHYFEDLKMEKNKKNS